MNNETEKIKDFLEKEKDIFNPYINQKDKNFVIDKRPIYIINRETRYIYMLNKITDKYEKTKYKVGDFLKK